VSTLRHAFKEWAVIVQALAEGRQVLILRKGGIAEKDGAFQVEQMRFWLYPTYFHEKQTGLRPEAADLLKKVDAARPGPDVVRLTHFAEVAGVYHLRDLETALKLEPLHLWSQETVQQRFLYRTPGLYVLPVRVFRAARATDLEETAAFAGCKTWVDLEHDLATDGAEPVLSEPAFDTFRRHLHALLEEGQPMADSLKGQVLCAEQRNGPDRWHAFYLVVNDEGESLDLLELAKTVVAGDAAHGMEKPIVPAVDLVRVDPAVPLVRARKIANGQGDGTIASDDLRLVIYGGKRSWNERGEVVRAACPLHVWDGSAKPFDYNL
jgi:hypothetical protein